MLRYEYAKGHPAGCPFERLAVVGVLAAVLAGILILVLIVVLGTVLAVVLILVLVLVIHWYFLQVCIYAAWPLP